MRKPSIVPVAFAALVLSCSDGPGVIRLEENAFISGIAYIDRDGNGQFGASDGVAAGVRAALILEATGDTVASATSRADGTFSMSRVSPGRYRLVATRGTAGDSIDVLQIDSSRITLAANDSAVRHIRLGYPRTSVEAARLLPAGRRITMEGIALNGWATFGDSVIHFSDRSGAMRAVRVPQSAIQAGDSISMVGTTGLGEGRVVLADARAWVVGPARGLPPIDSVATAVAATAAGADRSDGQVRIAGAVIVDTVTVAGERILGVNDGSGRLEVVLDASVTFNPGPYVTGGTISAAGVLVPAPSGNGWRLKPRERAELTLSFTVVPTSAARTLPVGQQAVLQGLALNSWAAFGDSTVHLLDSSGALRAVRVAGTVTAGDSIRLVGVMGTRSGQPVLTGATASVLRAGAGLPAPDSISTLAARTAQQGARDADRVRVAGSITGSQAVSGGGTLFTVDDGSGALEVLVAPGITLPPGPFVPGALLDVTGVLVPTGTGTWRLKPTRAADASASYPTATVAEARALPAGRLVQLRAIALNGWSDFGDGSVHLIDGTGTIRVIGVPSSFIFRGDSVLIHGTAESFNGQPVLRALGVPPGPAPAVLLQGVGTPAADSVSTLVASTADGGARDADQFRVRGTISLRVQAGADLLLTVSDGSGDLVVRLQPSQRFPAGSFNVGDVVRVAGVLVPTPSGAWELKPRSVAEITVAN
jgi:hypothetical protein